MRKQRKWETKYIKKDDMEKVEEKDLILQLEGFPREIVELMLRRQEEQTGKRDIKIFQNNASASRFGGGFDWLKTPEGASFWRIVIVKQDFEMGMTAVDRADVKHKAFEDIREILRLEQRRMERKPTMVEKEIELFRKMMEAATVSGIPAPPKTDGMTENRVKEIATKVYSDCQNLELPLKDQLKELGFYPHPVTVEVKSSKKETKKVENQHFLFPNVLKCLVARVNVALVGPAGSGKTSMVHNAANALDLPFYSKSVSAQTGVHEFFGYQDANGKFVRTLFREAYEKGGVFLVDEFDAGNPNVLAALNQATANGSCAFPDKMVDKHKDFIAVMAGNTFGTGATAEYVGRNKIDAATLDRFVFIEVPYDETLEMALATDKEWCRKVQQFRAQAEKKKIKCIISPRATFNGQAMLAAGMEEDFVLKTTVFKGLSEDEIRLLTEEPESEKPWAPGVSPRELKRLLWVEWDAEKTERRKEDPLWRG